MRISREKLISEAEKTGFRTEVLEKTAQALHLLNAIDNHPSLKGKLALKGGTALNLFFLDVPRLSVDIDLNYIGAENVEAMRKERETVDQALLAVISREDFSIKRVPPPDEHAGGKWSLKYNNAFGQSANLEVDVNYLFRIQLWPSERLPSHRLGVWQAKGFPVMDFYEIAAGKLAALLSRNAARDLFDCHQILQMADLDQEQLRIAFVAYAGMNFEDLRERSKNDVEFDPKELVNNLIPVLPVSETGKEKLWKKYGEKLVEECRKAMDVVLPFRHSEREFLDLLRENGEVEPSLLTSDSKLQDRIRRHPALNWRAFKVREAKGLS